MDGFTRKIVADAIAQDEQVTRDYEQWEARRQQPEIIHKTYHGAQPTWDEWVREQLYETAHVIGAELRKLTRKRDAGIDDLRAAVAALRFEVAQLRALIGVDDASGDSVVPLLPLKGGRNAA